MTTSQKLTPRHVQIGDRIDSRYWNVNGGGIVANIERTLGANGRGTAFVMTLTDGSVRRCSPTMKLDVTR